MTEDRGRFGRLPPRDGSDESDDDGPAYGSRSPTRVTRPAYTHERRAWGGLGQLGRVEKSAPGRFLHDFSSVFGDVAAFGFPVLYYVWATYPDVAADIVAPTFAAVAAMSVVGTLIRGGWVSPLASETLGWPTRPPILLLFRVLYFNGVIAAAVYGGATLGTVVEFPHLSLPFAALVGALSVLAFPTLCDAVYHRLG